MNEEKTYANLFISRKIYTTFRNICDMRGWKYNKQVENMMVGFIENHNKK